MQLIIYDNFKKRVNSTKRPTGGRTIDVRLKAGTSVERPVFLLQGIDLKANYCKWNNHYYYINDIMLGNNEIYELQCTQDLLATYKDEILAMSGYVEYSASSFNKWIPDHRLTMTNELEVTSKTASMNELDPCFVITVAGRDNDNHNAQVGLNCSYMITTSELNDLGEELYSDSIIDELKKAFTDVYNSIVSIHWLPYKPGIYPNNPDSIYLGNKQLQRTLGYGLKSNAGTGILSSSTIDIPWKYKDWRDFSPYSTLVLYLPFYGNVVLDQSKFKNETSIKIGRKLDPFTGEYVYLLTCGDYTEMFKTNVAVSLPIGQSQTSMVKGLTTTLGSAAAIGGGIGASMTGAGIPYGFGSIAAGVSQIASGISTTISQDVGSKGGIGSFASIGATALSHQLDIKLTLYSHKFGVSDPNNVNAIEGKPLYEVKTLSSLSGYVKCAGASVNIDGLAGDRIELNSIINSGFYIE